MKRMKKMFSLLLAVIMVLAMAVPGFADTPTGSGEGEQPPAPITSEGETGSITIDNPQQVPDPENGENATKSATYKAYKIFDVTYSGDNYAYSIVEGSKYWNTVLAYMDNPTLVNNSYSGKNITLTKTTQVKGGDAVYNVVSGKDLDAAGFAAHLAVSLKDMDPEEAFTTTASGLELGYYFVSTNSGALCNLTTTHPSITIHDKNDHTFTKTDNEAEDVEIGEVINYTITGKVPDTTGFISYIYRVEDTLTQGLSFVMDKEDADNVKVTVTLKAEGQEDVVLSKGETVADGKYTLTTAAATEGKPAEGENQAVPATGGAFTLQIDVMNLKQYIGRTIEVTYQAVVNDKAIATVEGNKAVLNYSNDPQNPTLTEPVNIPEEKVYTSKIVVDKFVGVYDEAGNAILTEEGRKTKLAGATFVLYKETTEGELYYKLEDENGVKKVTWVAQDAADSFTTDANGAVQIIGLKNGTYKLKETVAPTGYNLLTEAKEITINGGESLNKGSVEEQTAVLTQPAMVPNRTGVELPGTGGIGTTIFYAAGIILMAGAVFFVIRRKKA